MRCHGGQSIVGKLSARQNRRRIQRRQLGHVLLSSHVVVHIPSRFLPKKQPALAVALQLQGRFQLGDLLKRDQLRIRTR